MNTVEILTKARELISDESRWTRGSYAVTDEGRFTQPWEDDACRFCALGAIKKAGGFRDDSNPAAKFLGEVLRAQFVDNGRVDDFNDARSHAEVIALFDRAIAAARED